MSHSVEVFLQSCHLSYSRIFFFNEGSHFSIYYVNYSIVPDLRFFLKKVEQKTAKKEPCGIATGDLHLDGWSQLTNSRYKSA